MSFMESESSVAVCVPQPHSLKSLAPMKDEAARPDEAALRSAFEKNGRSLLFFECLPMVRPWQQQQQQQQHARDSADGARVAAKTLSH